MSVSTLLNLLRMVVCSKASRRYTKVSSQRLSLRLRQCQIFSITPSMVTSLITIPSYKEFLRNRFAEKSVPNKYLTSEWKRRFTRCFLHHYCSLATPNEFNVAFTPRIDSCWRKEEFEDWRIITVDLSDIALPCLHYTQNTRMKRKLRQFKYGQNKQFENQLKISKTCSQQVEIRRKND